MFRYVVSVSLLAVAAVMLGGFYFLVGQASESEQEGQRTPRPSKSRELRQFLQQPVDMMDMGPNTTLKDVLEYLTDAHGLTIVVNHLAFQAIGVQMVEEHPVYQPKMKGASLATVLRMLLGQIKGDIYTGSYLVRSGYLEITSSYHCLVEAWQLPDGTSVGPPISGEFLRTPFDEALEDLADQSGITIVLDNRLSRQRRPVTASFTHVRVDRAVQVMAEMVDLRCVVLENMLYVTSVDRARELEANEAKRREIMYGGGVGMPGPGLPGGGNPFGGVNPFGGAVPPAPQ